MQIFSFKVCFVLSIKNAGVVLASGVGSFCRFSVRCRFSVSEVCLNFRKRVGPLRNGKEPILVTIFLPKLISDQAVRLAFSNFREAVSVFWPCV